MKIYCEYKDEKSSKFWEIKRDGKTVTTRYGKIGTAGQVTEKVFETAEKADKECQKLIKEKTGKGYISIGQNSAASTKTDCQTASYREADERFDIKAFFTHNAFLSYDKIEDWFADVAIFEGDTVLDNLIGRDYDTYNMIIVNGSLKITNDFKVYGSEHGLRGILVLGKVEARTMVVGYADICITGDVTITKYVHAVSPDFECGEIEIKGNLDVPLFVQEDYNPAFRLNTSSRLESYGPEDLSDYKEEHPGDFSMAEFIDFLNKSK